MIAPPKIDTPKSATSPWAYIIPGGVIALAIFASFLSNAQAEQKQKAEAQIRANEDAEYARGHAREIAEASRRSQEYAKEAAEISASLGPKPKPSAWDGITPEANEYLKQNAKDFDSIKIVECSDVVPGEGCWIQRVKFRAKNSFGAYGLVEGYFYIKDGQCFKADLSE